MVCLGLEPGAAGWKAQTNPLSYCGTPKIVINTLHIFQLQDPFFMLMTPMLKLSLQKNCYEMRRSSGKERKIIIQ